MSSVYVMYQKKIKRKFSRHVDINSVYSHVQVCSCVCWFLAVQFQLMQTYMAIYRAEVSSNLTWITNENIAYIFNSIKIQTWTFRQIYNIVEKRCFCCSKFLFFFFFVYFSLCYHLEFFEYFMCLMFTRKVLKMIRVT